MGVKPPSHMRRLLMSETTRPKPGVTIAEPEKRRKTKRRFQPLWYVILHDDQDHTYRYVIEMLVHIFKMDGQKALVHAMEVDSQGVTIVARLPKEEAMNKRDQITSYGGDPWLKTGHSMEASIEPADD